jgi:phosphoglycerol transferase MdoB-like AlkP superfamily enzyme
MGSWTRTNEWGVPDADLYRFVAENLSDDRPTFDLVLTTSNHPPYDVDVWAEGWPVREIPAGMEVGFEASGIPLREIGHHGYADREMGRFVREISARSPTSLFAVTGDHFSRRFPGAHPSLWERTAVPLLLYGKSALRGRSLAPGAIGSHHDIVPTLVELVAPAGFAYHAIGRSLFSTERAPFAIGPLGRVLGRGWIADLRHDVAWEPLPGEPGVPGASGGPIGAPDLAAARSARGDFLGVAWWRIRFGPDWEASPSGP